MREKMKKNIQTDQAPKAMGCYSQAIQSDNIIYLSGQIPLDSVSMTMASDISAQIHQVFKNLKAVAEAAGGSLNHMVKLTIYLIDIASLATVNEIMPIYFTEPYPARTSFAVVALPKGALVEVDGIMRV